MTAFTRVGGSDPGELMSWVSEQPIADKTVKSTSEVEKNFVMAVKITPSRLVAPSGTRTLL